MEQEDDVKVVRVENLKNPYMSQDNFVQSSSTLASNLFLQNTDELFQCGQFCAVFINPCILHTGLFVLQPTSRVFDDMKHQLDFRRDNPDGTNQGFIGGYFPGLLDQLLFHPLVNGTKLDGHYRLPLGYQMDATYYYLRLRWSVPCGPNNVITFPGAPWLKPWYWWSWPVLPLGIQWHERRRHTLGYGAEMPFIMVQGVFYLGIIAVTRLAHPSLSKLCYRRADKSVTFIQTGLKAVAIISLLLSYTVLFFIIPHTIHPVVGWSLYLLGSFALSCIAINAFLLQIPFLVLFCMAPVLWVSLNKVVSSLHVSLEMEAFLPSTLSESTEPGGFNKLY